MIKIDSDEESDENYEKVKAGVIDSIKYNMDYLIEKLNIMNEEL